MKIYRVFAVCALALLIFAAPASSASQHFGLFVGLNTYDPSLGAGDLPSCINDADGMRAMLGYDANRWNDQAMTSLYDTGATKGAIRAELANLAAQAVSGDVVIYYHSSHGTGTGLDSALCCYDALFYDDELAADLSVFATGVTVIVIVDACQSGGLFKSMTPKGKWTFPLNVQDKLSEIASTKALSKSPSIGWITACDYFEYCDAGPVYSLFTAYLINGFGMGNTNADDTVTFLELFLYADPLATAVNPAQDAQSSNDALLSATVATSAFSNVEVLNEWGNCSGGNQYHAFAVPADIISVTVMTANTVGGDILDLGVNLPSTGTDPTTAYDSDSGEQGWSGIGNELVMFDSISIPGVETSGTYLVLVEPYLQGGPYTITASYLLPPPQGDKPIAVPEANEPDLGIAQLHSSSSNDPDGGALQAWEWCLGSDSQPNGSSIGTTDSFDHNFGAPGTYYVWLRVQDDETMWSDWASVTVEIGTVDLHDFEISDPGPTKYINEAFSVTVTARKLDDSVDTDFVGTLTFTCIRTNDTTVTMTPSTIQFQASDNGQVTVPNVVITELATDVRLKVTTE